LQRQDFGHAEKLADGVHPKHASPPKSGVEHGVTAG
jgi:hypothetical protein